MDSELFCHICHEHPSKCRDCKCNFCVYISDPTKVPQEGKIYKHPGARPAIEPGQTFTLRGCPYP